MAGAILIVDLDRHSVETLRSMVEEAGWEARAAYEWREIETQVAERRFDAVMADPKFPVHGEGGIIGWLRRNAPRSTIVALSLRAGDGHAGADMALCKPYTPKAVAGALEGLGRGAAAEYDFCGMLGRSEKMARLYSAVKAVAQTDSAALILGETGTGKELVAAAIHSLGARASKRFVTINCGALSESLLESELFGHEKGAFTGAFRPRPGKFEYANGGTVFLDEIGDISPATQLKLLKVIETGEVERLGGNQVIKTDSRMIFATNRDLAAEVEAGRFRRDLFYRVNTFPIRVPPLRERVEDIPALAGHFASMFGARHGGAAVSIGPEAMRWLMDRRWDGNVRELENIIERGVILSKGGVVSEADLQGTDEPAAARPGLAPEELSELTYRQMAERVMDMYEKPYFTRILSACGGNMSLAAKKAGLDRKTLYAKLAALGIDPGDFRGGKNGA
ncbi:MAG: sigma-54-dependent Fis family transcriptional regulator [Nitrospinae bacterium]|nr:sigma-54-dependent Fis family transcriptional regulator [Nitrospinota bacterium]